MIRYHNVYPRLGYPYLLMIGEKTYEFSIPSTSCTCDNIWCRISSSAEDLADCSWNNTGGICYSGADDVSVCRREEKISITRGLLHFLSCLCTPKLAASRFTWLCGSTQRALKNLETSIASPPEALF